MSPFNRRKFILSGAAGAAGLMVVNPVTGAAKNVKRAGERDIIHRTLGKTGIKVPVVSIGASQSNTQLVRACLESGMTHIDTAHGYQRGQNEVMLGEVLKDYSRDSFNIATKARVNGLTRDGKPSDNTDVKEFENQFNISLERLQLDYVDFFHVHGVSSAELVNYEPVVEFLLRIKKEGRARHIGISTHSNEPLVIDAMIENGNYDVVVVAYNFKQDHHAEVAAAITRADKAGMGIVGMKAVAGGFLDRQRTQPVNSSASIKWCLSHPGIHTTIPGMRNFDEIEANLPIMEDITMTEEEKRDIIIATGESGLYCNNCAVCEATCAKNLPVPEMMRAYMYAYGYANPTMAYDLLAETGVTANPCDGCDECCASCTKGFNVREKVTDIARLITVPQEFMV